MTANHPDPSTSPPRAPGGVDAPPPRLDLLALFAALSVATLGVGGWLTSLGFGAWYDGLPKPGFQPPGWVFGPVWTSLFVLLTLATWQVARHGAAARTSPAQLVLNVAWSGLFFTAQRPDLALVDIAVLDLVVLAMIVAYGRMRRSSGWLLVPYAVWLGLATAINVWIVRHT